MAHHIMYHQGQGHGPLPLKCGGGPEFTCPTSKRIADEYGRGFYTLTNVLNPNWDDDYFGRTNWQQKLVKDVAVGDHLWLVYVPPKHNLYDIAGYAETTLTGGSNLESLAGMQAEIVVGEVDVTDGRNTDLATCEPISIQSHGTLNFPTGSDPEEIFVQAKIEKVTMPKKGLVVGIKVNRMPTGKLTLSDIQAKIAIVAHVFGYDSQTHM